MFGIFKRMTTGESLLMKRYCSYTEAFRDAVRLKQQYHFKMEIVRIGGVIEL